MNAFERLRAATDGPLRLPGDPGFIERSQPFNERFRDIVPAAVLSAAGTADVARAIAWSRETGLHLAPRGGGHSYAGHSSNRELVLDLSPMDQIHVDRSTGLVTVGGGTRMRALNDSLREHGLALPLGNSDSVGIGGLVLGGGAAVVSRSMGLTCDTLVSTEMVLANGQIVTCNEQHNEDLFWACRGGGGGNFGVNTSFTFQAQLTRPTSTCLMIWARRHAIEVLAIMQEVMHRAPDEFAARIGINRRAGQKATVSVVGQHLGPAEELRDLVAPALSLAPPDRVDIADRNYWAAVEYLRHSTAEGAFAVRTRTTDDPLVEDGLKTMVAAVDEWPGSDNPDGARVALFTWGGAINHIPVEATAFPHRNTLFLVSMDTSWQYDDSTETVQKNLDWLDTLYTDMGQYASDASYVNFTDPSLHDWRMGYYGPNAARLTEVKNRHDPERIFSFDQAI